MKESFESQIKPTQETPRRSQIKTEFGQFRKDWFIEKGIDIEGKSISELKDLINQFYAENEDVLKEKLEEKGKTIEEDISTLAKSKLDLKDFREIRKELNLPKWISLNEAVAFIKTIIDIDDRSAQERYAEYAANGISLDDMRRVLAFENDVKPARLDTDIYHQSPQRSRSVVEIASNAVDAVNAQGTSIGRFGVGFYQILSHLKDSEDRVKVTTGNSDNGFFDIEFRLHNDSVEIHIEEAENTKGEKQPNSGTIVELITKNFPKEEAENLIKKHLAYNSTANIFSNEKLVNDTLKFGVDDKLLPEVKITIEEGGYRVEDNGIGMSPQVILEKLLVPKFSGKKPVQEMLDMDQINPTFLIEKKSDLTTSGKTVINVGGVTIEEFELSGVNTLQTLVLDLPAFTVLGEERNKVAVDQVTIAAVKKLCDRVVESGDFEIINSFAPAVAALQKRSLNHDRENNLLSYLQQKAEQLLPNDLSYLPNTEGFERLEIPNTALVNPNVRQTNWGKIEGIDFVPNQIGDGLNLYVSKIKPDVGSPVVQYGRRLILDESIYEKYKNDPTLLNLFLKYYGEGNATDVKSISSHENGKTEETRSQEKESYSSYEDFVMANWEALGFESKEYAKIDMEVINPAVRNTRQEVYEKIICKLPAHLGILFVDITRHYPNTSYKELLTPENLDHISSVANSPELMETLNTLGAVFEPKKEKAAESFPEMGKRWHKLKIDDDESWAEVEYKDKWRLIDKKGKLYPGTTEMGYEGYTHRYRKEHTPEKGFSMESKKGLIPVIERAEKEVTINFYNPDNDTTETIKIPLESKYSGLHAIANFGDRRIAAISDRGGVYLAHYASGRESPGMHGGYLVDLDTGEILDPRVEAGIPETAYLSKINDEYIDYFEETKKTLIRYHLDGTVENIISEWWKDPKVKLEKNLSDNFNATYQNGSLKFYSGDRVIYEKKFYFGGSDPWEFGDIDQESISAVWHFFKGGWSDGAIRTKVYDKGNAKFLQVVILKDKMRTDSVLLNEDGDVVYSPKPGEFIASNAINQDGENVFLVLEGVNNWDYSPNYFYIDEKGNKVESIDNILFDIGRNSPDPSQFPILKNTSWSLKGHVGEYGRPYMRVVNKSDGKYVEELSTRDWGGIPFDTVQYVPDKNLWRCIETDELGRKEKEGRRRVFYIDSEAKIVDQKEYKTNHWGALYNRDDFVRKDLIKADSSLPKEKLTIMNRVIENSQVEDSDQIDLFVKRSFESANIGSNEFEIIAPVLIKLDYMDKRLINNESINHFEARLKQYDSETKVWFYKFLSNILPKELDDIADNPLSEKLMKVYQEKIAHLSEEEKQEIFDTLSQIREYHRDGDIYLITGLNIIKNQSPVPSEQIPERIRALVDYLRSDEMMSMAPIQEEIMFGNSEDMTLSQLIQTKRLNEKKVSNFNGTAEELGQLVKEKTQDKKQDHIKREIIHPIYYQSIDNPYLFIRELVQNAHDAVKKDPNIENNRIAVDIFSRTEGDVTLKIDDPVGMSPQEVINYFLIPGESTKIGDEETIGYFGQGLFTLFRGSKEVVLKTSKGDGRITKLKVVPLKDEKGMTTDLKLQFEEEAGQFKGTTIERTVDAKYETVEAAYIKNATCTYTSLVDGNIVNIVLNGQSINRPQDVLSEINIPELGPVSIIDAPNNTVTQRGLYVKGLDEDFSTKMYDVEELLKKRGIVIQIPDQISLTRSRNEIARKEEVMEKMNEYIPLLKLQAYLELFRKDIDRGSVIQLDNLPYDYFNSPYSRKGKIAKDAQSLKEGKPIKDVSTYFERGSLIELLVLLPVVEIENETYSLADLKEAALQNKPPLDKSEKYDKLPEIIRKKLLEGKHQYEARGYDMQTSSEKGVVVKDFSFSDWKNMPDIIKMTISSNEDGYNKMNDMIHDLNSLISKSFGKDDAPKTSFYMEPGSKAHANQNWGQIGWNLNFWRGWMIDAFKKEYLKDRNLREFYDVLTHEWAHVIEKTGAFTHNQSFYRKQTEVLSHLMYKEK